MLNASHAEQTFSYSKFVVMGICFFCLAGFALLIDIPFAQSCRSQSLLPGDLRAVVRLSEVFAHGAGVVLILLCIWATMNVDRRKVFRVACCAFVPGAIVAIGKVVISRSRPNSLTELPAYVSDTFHGFLPALQSGESGLLLERQFQSFPSGHSATAVGFAIGLSWLFPRGKWCFALFALLAIFQRLDSGAHFPSDTMVSVGIAAIVAGRYVTPGWESRLLSRFEQRQNVIAKEVVEREDEAVLA